MRTLVRSRTHIEAIWVVLGLVSVLTVVMTIGLTLYVITVGAFGLDYVFYRDVAQRWLETGRLYADYQLAGPYVAQLTGQGSAGDNLYPPSALALFVPFVWLPAVLWWTIPIGVTLYVLWSWRPTPLAVCVMLALLAWPRAIGAYLFGNTDMWACAAVAAGLRWGWPALAVTMKPTFVPFALLGIRHRSWWIALGIGLAVVVLTAPAWLDYLTVVRNTSIPTMYSLGSLPLLAIPLVAWGFRKRVTLRGDESRLSQQVNDVSA